jgi:hypothetical protein
MKDIVLGLISSLAAIFAFVTFLITRRDQRKNKLEQLIQVSEQNTKSIIELNKNDVRMQLFLLIHIIPKNAADILPLAYHYFVELNGDQYLTGQFADWLKSQNIDKPIWFKEKH